MMSSPGRHRVASLLAAAFLLPAVLLVSERAAGECLTDLRGNVYCGAGQYRKDKSGKIWCSRHYEGGALVTIEGLVLCGVGRCAKDKYGRVYCSSEIGGAVVVDREGYVNCFGRCEEGSIAHCSSEIGDKSPETPPR